MAKYVVRYEQIFMTTVEAHSEEEALRLANRADFVLDETTEYRAELEEPRGAAGFEGGFAENH